MTLNLQRINQRNEYIKKQYFKESHQEGMNMPLLENLKDQKYMYDNEQKFIQSVKRVKKQN